MLREWTSDVLQPALQRLADERSDGTVVFGFDFAPLLRLTELHEIITTDVTLAALPLPSNDHAARPPHLLDCSPLPHHSPCATPLTRAQRL